MMILVVGGAGYIGSTAAEYLLSKAHHLIVMDNLSLGHRQSVPANATFVHGDTGNHQDLAQIFKTYPIDAVMHFAANALVGESMEHPALYFKNNVVNGINLLDTMLSYSVRKIVFSSTCAVYGEPDSCPIKEDFPCKPTNPYGESKLAFEKILQCYAKAYGLQFASLRYFNAAGASAARGEDHEPETHLIPLLLAVANGKLDQLTIFGDDYPTTDGTCVRDYIHVLDLATAHEKALNYINSTGNNAVFNLGNGNGFSVREVVDVARKVTGHRIPVRIGPRRMGDSAILVASNDLIGKELGWQPLRSNLESIISDAWKWHQANPAGYRFQFFQQDG